MRTSPCPHSNYAESGHRTARHDLADEHLAEADQIVRELFPDAAEIVFADDLPDDQGMPRIAHVLGAHGVLLYSPGEHDLLNDLMQIHLADAVRSHSPGECE